jgi:hypothetical protein
VKKLTIARMGALAALLCSSPSVVMADTINVRVNGDPVYFEGAKPREMNGRVLVPLRGVLEKMGATVDWMPSSQTVVAAKGDMELNLPIGSRFATVNGRQVRLDVPAMTIAGSTMVPLRFVSEALGADVTWREASNTVLISTDGSAVATTPDRDFRQARREYRREYRQAENNGRRVTLPTGTVIPVRLDEALSSNENREGDTFTATVVSGQDDAGLPEGTRIEGVVREAIAENRGKPGVLDLDIRRIVFPNESAKTITADVISLNGKNIDRKDGRLVASGSRNNEQLKWVGIGAGAGLLIGTLTKGNTLVDTLLGAGAGFLYNELQRKGASDVNLKSGTEFGVRLNKPLAFNAPRY